MLAKARANIIVANANKAGGLAGIIRKTVERYTLRDVIAVDKLVGYRHVKLDESVHLVLNSLLLFSARLVVGRVGDFTLLAFDVGGGTALATKHANHQLIEKMLGCMGWRELFLVVRVKHVIIGICHNLEFVYPSAICSKFYR